MKPRSKGQCVIERFPELLHWNWCLCVLATLFERAFFPVVSQQSKSSHAPRHDMSIQAADLGWITQIMYLDISPEHRLEEKHTYAGRPWSAALDSVTNHAGLVKLC